MPSPWDGFNPRWIAFCRSQGYKSHEQALAGERERWPGGVMCGFLLWIDERWRIWRKYHGIPRDLSPFGWHHRDFDLWLDADAP